MLTIDSSVKQDCSLGDFMGGGTPHEKSKNQCKIQKCSKLGLYVSYRAENLHAEIFLKVMWVLDRSKVSKVSKIIDFE